MSGCFHSLAGAQAFGAVRSYLATAGGHGENLLDVLRGFHHWPLATTTPAGGTGTFTCPLPIRAEWRGRCDGRCGSTGRARTLEHRHRQIPDGPYPGSAGECVPPIDHSLANWPALEVALETARLVATASTAPYLSKGLVSRLSTGVFPRAQQRSVGCLACPNVRSIGSGPFS